MVENPRKQPKQRRSEATVEVILQATARILVDFGFEKLTTNRIADRAGVSVGSIYQYFPNKQAITTELIRRKRRKLLSGLKTALSQQGREPFAVTVDKLIRATIAHQWAWPQLSRALDRAQTFLPLADETRAFEQEMGAAILSFLEASNLPAKPEIARDMIAIVQAMIERASLAGETDKDALRDRVTGAVIRYLQPA